jgi:hypothetical protein
MVLEDSDLFSVRKSMKPYLFLYEDVSLTGKLIYIYYIHDL